MEAQRRRLAQRSAVHLRRRVLRSADHQRRRERRACTHGATARRTANILAIDGADPRAGQNKGQKGWAIADIITFTDLAWGAGDHTIKAGIKYKDVDLTAADSIPGNPVFYYDVTAAGTATIPWKAVFALPLAGFDSEVTTNDKQFGVFVQDDWTVNDHLTLNLGIRWDVEKNPSYLDFVTPQFLIDSLNTEDRRRDVTYGQSLAFAPIRIPASTSTTTSALATTAPDKIDAFQPRFGFSYDFGGDQQHVIFGGAGRAYDRTLYDYLQLEQTKFTLATTRGSLQHHRSSLHRQRRASV